jgi:hypothetical protein
LVEIIQKTYLPCKLFIIAKKKNCREGFCGNFMLDSGSGSGMTGGCNFILDSGLPGQVQFILDCRVKPGNDGEWGNFMLDSGSPDQVRGRLGRNDDGGCAALIHPTNYGLGFGVKSLFLTNYQKILAYPLVRFCRSFINNKDLIPTARSPQLLAASSFNHPI